MRLNIRWWQILILRESAGSVAGTTNVGLGEADRNIDFRRKTTFTYFGQKSTSAELQKLVSSTHEAMPYNLNGRNVLITGASR